VCLPESVLHSMVQLCLHGRLTAKMGRSYLGLYIPDPKARHGM